MKPEIRHYFENKIARLRQDGLYRTYIPINRKAGAFPQATRDIDPGSSKVVVCCTNDYLGMGQHPGTIAAMIEATKELGAGSGGSRNIAGTSRYHVALEAELAALHRKEAGLLFTSGYTSNEASLSAIAQVLPDCVFVSDELNHASLIQGIRNSRAEKAIFRHNDANHLRDILSRIAPERPKVVVFESIYSMEGDSSPLEAIADAADEFGAMTFLDEVHAVGMYGPEGAGMAAERGIADRFDIIQGTLAKGFGAVGGYITGSAPVVDAVRSLGSSFIFTTSLPPGNVAGALAAVRWLRQSDAERAALRAKVKLLHAQLEEHGIQVASRDTHIAPVIIGDAERCTEVARRLLNEFGIYVQPINYPSVPVGTARLRVTPTPLHSDAEIDRFVSALQLTLKGSILLAA
jgi:5-aminolevulinate synthase